MLPSVVDPHHTLAFSSKGRAGTNLYHSICGCCEILHQLCEGSPLGFLAGFYILFYKILNNQADYVGQNSQPNKLTGQTLLKCLSLHKRKSSLLV
jgi:hypothetical protein